MAQCTIKEMYIVASGGTAIEISRGRGIEGVADSHTTTIKIALATGNLITLKFDPRGDLLTIGTDVVQPEKV